MYGLTETDSQQLQAAARSWSQRDLPLPRVWLVAGSGLSGDLGLDSPVAEMELGDVMPFPVRSVVGHPHKISVFADSGNGAVAYQQGRLHLYQGYSANQVAFSVRLAALLGARTLVMSNAAGSLREDWGPGTLVAISDHLNLTGRNPLVGQVPASWGPQFPDMCAAYDPALIELAQRHAKAQDLELPRAVYAGLLGPTYETPAEVRMIAALGGELVGMSTVTEVIAAHHLGMRCLCFSLVANLAAGMTDKPLDHQEVLAAAAEAAGRFAGLLKALLADGELAASGR